MDVGAQLLERFLVRDAEALLFVDDDKAESLELRGLAEDRVGADDDVHRPVGERLRGSPSFPCGGTSRDRRPTLSGKPAKRSLKPGKCWRASSVVGATSATCWPFIAATKAARSATSVLPKPTSPQTSRSIGLPSARSLEHVLDRLLLVVGLLPREALDELVVGAFVGLEHRRLAQQALGGGEQQLVGDRADAFLEPRLAPLPAFAAEPVERRAFLGRAVAREDVDVLDRDEQLVAPGVLEPHAIVLALPDGDRLEPQILADAVVEMDHEIAAVERRKLGEEGVRILPPLAPPDEAIAQQVLFGDQLELVVGEAGVERQNHRHRRAFCRRARALPASSRPSSSSRPASSRIEAMRLREPSE